MGYLERFLRRGGPAMAGLRHLARTQRGDVVAYLLALTVQWTLGLWLRLPARDLALLWLATSLVLFAEVFNTALESVVDRVGLERHPLSGRAKDLAAGAVFLAMLIALVCALLLLLPPLAGRLA